MDMKHKVLDGGELFKLNGNPFPAAMKDFWAWSMSRIIADGPRGDLAEFIVNTALGMDMTIPKCGWGECDIVYPFMGKAVRIEVKCSTVLQAWERPTPPKPVFSIAKTLNCDVEEYEAGYRFVGRNGEPPRRRSEIYVFCLFANSDRGTADPMDLDQWRFYIVPTKTIDDQLGDQRKISIQGLERIGAALCGFGGIKPVVDELASRIEWPEDA